MFFLKHGTETVVPLWYVMKNMDLMTVRKLNMTREIKFIKIL